MLRVVKVLATMITGDGGYRTVTVIFEQVL